MQSSKVPESMKPEIMQQSQDLNFGLSDLKLGVFAVCYTYSLLMTEFLPPMTTEGFLPCWLFPY